MESSANSFCRTIWPGKICIPKQVPSWFWCSTASNPLLPQGGASIVWQVLARFQGCTTFQSATGHRSTDVRLKKRACTVSVLQECSRCFCTRPVHKAKKKGTKFTFLFVRWAFVDKDRGKKNMTRSREFISPRSQAGMTMYMFDYVRLVVAPRYSPELKQFRSTGFFMKCATSCRSVWVMGLKDFNPSSWLVVKKKSMQHAFFATYTMDMHQIYHQSVVQDRCLNDIDSWDDFGFVLDMKINDCGT